MKCETCNKEHQGVYGSGRFCSRGCSNSRGPRTEEFKIKVSNKLLGRKFGPRGPLSDETKAKISASLIGKPNGRKQVFANEQVFVENSSYPRHRLKERIIKQKLLRYVCFDCGNEGNHNGKPLVLQLDHIDGVNNNNVLNNLRFLCPNCHSQQDTYGAKNIGRYKSV